LNNTLFVPSRSLLIRWEDGGADRAVAGGLGVCRLPAEAVGVNEGADVGEDLDNYAALFGEVFVGVYVVSCEAG
jgi:hypothetical protein